MSGRFFDISSSVFLSEYLESQQEEIRLDEQDVNQRHSWYVHVAWASENCRWQSH